MCDSRFSHDTDAAPRAEGNHSASESGMALVMSLFFAVVVTGVIASGSIYLRTYQASSKTKFQVFSQATQFARSGLTETLSWFRRQPSQPVLAFEPQIDLLSDPQIVDTLDSDVGIVREFRISNETWGRYEVWKEWLADPDPDRAAWRATMASGDVSEARGLGASGSAWRIRAIGYVFEQNNPSHAFDEAPNRIFASRILESELLRLKISPPGQAAVSVRYGSRIAVGAFGRIDGGSMGAGVFYWNDPSSGTPPAWTPSQVDGLPPVASSSTYDDSYRGVFGVGYQDLRAIADSYITDQVDFPNPVPLNSVVITEAPTDIVFNAARPLRGSGLVVVKGNVTIAAGSASSFTGFLFVDGDLTVNGVAEITGAVTVTGDFLAQGLGDFATVTFDDAALTALRLEIGQYRLAGAIRPLNGE